MNPNHDHLGNEQFRANVAGTVGLYSDQAGPPRTIRGVGPDAPIVENAQGGKQSASPYRFDLVDPLAWMNLARVLDYGARRYEPNNWRKIGPTDHVNHALMHIVAWLAGDQQEDHLGHAQCRIHMALATALADGYDGRQGDEREGQP